MRIISQEPENWGPESAEESLLTTVGFFLLKIKFSPPLRFYFVEEKEGRKRNVELHQMLHFFEILQGKKEEEIEMTASPDSSTPSQVKAALLAQQRRSARMTLLISSHAS